MREIVEKFNVYKFHELSEEIKSKVIDRYWDINVEFEWWDNIYDDAKQIGLEIESFDLYREGDIETKLILSEAEICENILKNHGEKCDTCILANEYLKKNRTKEEFRYELSEEYLSMLRKEYEYLTSEDAIIEAITCNEFEFTINGKFYFDI